MDRTLAFYAGYACVALCLPLGAFSCSQTREGREPSEARRGASTEALSQVPAKEVTPDLAKAAERLLEENIGAPLGTELVLEHSGERYVARIEEHYNEPGGAQRPWGPHRGITLYRRER